MSLFLGRGLADPKQVFKVFNQEFIVDQRYNVNKELGQGAYGIVWYVLSGTRDPPESLPSDTSLSHPSIPHPLSHSCIKLMLLFTPAQPSTPRPTKALPSKRSPMFSAKRSSQSAPCARSSSYNTSEVCVHSSLHQLLRANTFPQVTAMFALPSFEPTVQLRLNNCQITCLYDMDIPRPDNFNEAYLYEGM